MERCIVRSSALRRNVRNVELATSHPSRLLVVKSRIQANMLWAGGTGFRTHDGVIVEQFRQRNMIIDIGGCHNEAQRNATSIHQDVIFHPGFGAVSGIGAIIFFPPMATAHKCRHCFAIPIQFRACARSL